VGSNILHHKCSRLYHFQTKEHPSFLGKRLNPPKPTTSPNLDMTPHLWLQPINENPGYAYGEGDVLGGTHSFRVNSWIPHRGPHTRWVVSTVWMATALKHHTLRVEPKNAVCGRNSAVGSTVNQSPTHCSSITNRCNAYHTTNNTTKKVSLHRNRRTPQHP